MAGRLKAAHCALALPRRLMRILGAIVQALMMAVFDTRHHLLVRGLVAPKFVRNEHTRNILAPFEHLAEEFLGRSLVPTALDENIEHIAVLVDLFRLPREPADSAARAHPPRHAPTLPAQAVQSVLVHLILAAVSPPHTLRRRSARTFHALWPRLPPASGLQDRRRAPRHRARGPCPETYPAWFPALVTPT